MLKSNAISYPNKKEFLEVPPKNSFILPLYGVHCVLFYFFIFIFFDDLMLNVKLTHGVI